MLKNYEVKTTVTIHEMLLRMSAGYTPFFLTGSRFFGTDRPGSDWDFFTNDNACTRELLKKYGFMELIHNTKYLDANTTAVFRWIPPDDHKWIDVQLVDNEVMKDAVQNILKANNIVDVSTPMWNAMFAAYKQGMSWDDPDND